MGANSLKKMEMDAIGEIMNISLGASATAVSTMLGTRVNITTPEVEVQTREEFEFQRMEPAIGVEISYTEGLSGKNIMMFRRDDVRIIVGMLMGEEIPADHFEMDEIHLSAICEVMNQMMGSSATALSEFLGTPVNISTPVSFEIKDPEDFKNQYFSDPDGMVVVRFQLEIEGKLKSEFMNIMSIGLTRRLLEPFSDTIQKAQEDAKGTGQTNPDQADKISVSEIIREEEPKPSVQPQVETFQQNGEERRETVTQKESPDPSNAANVASHPAYTQPHPVPQVSQPVQAAAPYQQDPAVLQLLAQMQQTQVQMMELMRDLKKGEPEEQTIIRPIRGVNLTEKQEAGQEEKANQEMLMTVPLEVSVEIGRTKKLVRDILEFTQGSLVVLDKMAGEQVDLFVNGQCVAKGDIVVVEDNFGIRITEIVSGGFTPENL